jgi:hypothetical protein
MYCCDGFRNLVSLAGERGLAILARVQSSGEIGFVFQSRGVAFSDVGKLRPASIDVTINIEAVTGMRFCSACGRRLEDLVKESPEFFRELAELHQKILASSAVCNFE